MSLQSLVEQTVQGLGLDLVEIERSAGGLLRITIDLPWMPEHAALPEQFVTIEDCEKVTRQLQYALEVDGNDFLRFVGEEVDITLKEPIGPNESSIAANRKKFRGTLEQTESGWQIVWSDAPPVKPGQRVSKKKAPPPLQALGFVLDEVREARLAPVVDFKGRRKPAAANPAQEQPRPENDAQDTE